MRGLSVSLLGCLKRFAALLQRGPACEATERRRSAPQRRVPLEPALEHLAFASADVQHTVRVAGSRLASVTTAVVGTSTWADWPSTTLSIGGHSSHQVAARADQSVSRPACGPNSATAHWWTSGRRAGVKSHTHQAVSEK
jgi:hypothetical protein